MHVRNTSENFETFNFDIFDLKYLLYLTLSCVSYTAILIEQIFQFFLKILRPSTRQIYILIQMLMFLYLGDFSV